jgi:hypothetical protein
VSNLVTACLCLWLLRCRANDCAIRFVTNPERLAFLVEGVPLVGAGKLPCHHRPVEPYPCAKTARYTQAVE